MPTDALMEVKILSLECCSCICATEKNKLGARLTSGRAASVNVKWESFELAYLEDTTIRIL